MLVLSIQTLFGDVFVAFLSIPRAVGSVLCVACVRCDRFWVDGDFVPCRVHASGVVFRSEGQDYVDISSI